MGVGRKFDCGKLLNCSSLLDVQVENHEENNCSILCGMWHFICTLFLFNVVQICLKIQHKFSSLFTGN